jgi:hypothetical protein
VPAFEAAARSLKIEPIITPVHSDAGIETAMTSLGRAPGGGIVVQPDGGFTVVHRPLIILLAARKKLPAVYSASRNSSQRYLKFSGYYPGCTG